MKSARFVTLGRALVAAVAICAAAPSAKADVLTLNGESYTVSNGSSNSVNVAGVGTVLYAVSDTVSSSGVETLAVSLSVTGGGAGTSLTYDLKGSGYTIPYTGQLLTSSIAGTALGTVANDASYNGGTGLSSGAITTFGALSESKAVSGSGAFTLEESGTLTGAGASGSSFFVATAAVHGVPEPSGVIAAMAGLPCVGMLLGFARRLRRPFETAAAV